MEIHSKQLPAGLIARAHPLFASGGAPHLSGPLTLIVDAAGQECDMFLVEHGVRKDQ